MGVDTHVRCEDCGRRDLDGLTVRWAFAARRALCESCLRRYHRRVLERMAREERARERATQRARWLLALGSAAGSGVVAAIAAVGLLYLGQALGLW